jgi:hypothetical protein
MNLLSKVDLSAYKLGLTDEELDMLSTLCLTGEEVAKLPAAEKIVLDKLDYIPDDLLPANVQRRWLLDLNSGVEFLMFVGGPTVSLPYRLERINYEDGTAVLLNMNSLQSHATVCGRAYRWVYPEVKIRVEGQRKKIKHDVKINASDTVEINVKSRKYSPVTVEFQSGISTKELAKRIKQQLIDAGWNENTAISRSYSIAKLEAKAGRAINVRKKGDE